MGLAVVTTAERLRVINESLDRLLHTFSSLADAGFAMPNELLVDATDAVQALRDFARETAATAIEVETHGTIEPQSIHYRHGLRRVK